MPPSRCFLTKLVLSFSFYFGNVFLYEFLALSDDHDVICYSLFFCVILFLFTFFITLPSQWYTFLPPYLHSDDEDHERYDDFPVQL